MVQGEVSDFKKPDSKFLVMTYKVVFDISIVFSVLIEILKMIITLAAQKREIIFSMVKL